MYIAFSKADFQNTDISSGKKTSLQKKLATILFSGGRYAKAQAEFGLSLGLANGAGNVYQAKSGKLVLRQSWGGMFYYYAKDDQDSKEAKAEFLPVYDSEPETLQQVADFFVDWKNQFAVNMPVVIYKSGKSTLTVEITDQGEIHYQVKIYAIDSNRKTYHKENNDWWITIDNLIESIVTMSDYETVESIQNVITSDMPESQSSKKVATASARTFGKK